MPGIHATSLSVNLTGGCNAQCPYCIASATWKTGCKDNSHIQARLPAALKYAAFHNVDTVLITGSGEPLLPKNMGLVLGILDGAWGTGIPVTEVQTNGQTLAESADVRASLLRSHLNTIAISVSSPDPKRSAEMVGLNFDYLELAKKLSENFMIRISLNLTNAECLPLLNGGFVSMVSPS